MAVVHELSVHKGHIDNCQDLSAFFIRAIDNNSFGYCEAYLLYNEYSTNSLKDHTRQVRTAGRSSDPGSKVDPHISSYSWIARKERRVSLCTFVLFCKMPIVSLTQKGVFAADRFIWSPNSQYTEVSRYIDDTVCSCSTGWSRYTFISVIRMHLRCRCAEFQNSAQRAS